MMMARVKRGVVKIRRHKKLLDKCKGYYGRAKKCFRIAKRLHDHGMQYQYVSRKDNKGIYRAKFIAIINTGCRRLSTTYSKFIHLFNKSRFKEIYDRKTLALLVQSNFEQFTALFKEVTA